MHQLRPVDAPVRGYGNQEHLERTEQLYVGRDLSLQRGRGWGRDGRDEEQNKPVFVVQSNVARGKRQLELELGFLPRLAFASVPCIMHLRVLSSDIRQSACRRVPHVSLKGRRYSFSDPSAERDAEFRYTTVALHDSGGSGHSITAESLLS